MFDHAFAGKVAGVLSLLAFLPYIVMTARGRTRPNRATWIIWMVVGLMAGSSYWASGARETMWVPVSYIIGPSAVLLFALKYGEGGWTKLDRACLAMALMSGVLWWLTGNPLVALCLNIFVDFLGAVPTAVKAWRKPESEDRTAWMFWFLGSVANMFAVTKWTFSIAVYPVYMVSGISLIIFALYRPRRRR